MNGRNLVHATGATRRSRELALGALGLVARVRSVPTHPAGGSRSTLRILALTPTYVPKHRRGAEVTLHQLLVDLQQRGHEVRVVAGAGDRAGTFDGIDVRVRSSRRAVLRDGEWADIVFGQLTDRWSALSLGARARRPVVYLMHIGGTAKRALYGAPDLTVFCSHALRARHPWIAPAIVVHPPIDAARYATTRGDAITLVNLTAAKGAGLFYTLAAREPERQFLAVRGWEPELRVGTPPANCTVLDQVDDMREVFSRTRVLLVPSEYEAYGRVGLEAAVSGIPTIAHPADGLVEALGTAALWADRADPEAWIACLRSLDDPTEYERRSVAARARFEALDPATEIAALERALLQLRTTWTG